jgi:hypothetical protein
MSGDEPKCESCGVAWRDHAGPTGLCEQLRHAQYAVSTIGRLRDILNQAAMLQHNNGGPDGVTIYTLTRQAASDLKGALDAIQLGGSQ